VQVWPVSPLAILTGRFVEDSLVRLARNALPATAQLLLNDLQLMMGERVDLILQHMYMSYIIYYIYETWRLSRFKRRYYTTLTRPMGSIKVDWKRFRECIAAAV
jgi:hypothetical protein